VLSAITQIASLSKPVAGEEEEKRGEETEREREREREEEKLISSPANIFTGIYSERARVPEWAREGNGEGEGRGGSWTGIADDGIWAAIGTP